MGQEDHRPDRRARARRRHGGRPPVISADHPRTDLGKEELAGSIAGRDGITEGVVCVISAIQPCHSFTVSKIAEDGRLEIRLRQRKCAHHYLYLIDPEFGFMHICIQGWIPRELQISINGREWLAHQLDKAGVAYLRHDNALLRVENLERAAHLCEHLVHKAWPRILDAFARRVNPLLPTIRATNYGGYYWVLDQAEVATDVMCKSRQALRDVYPDLVRHASLGLSSDDVLGFLGRKLHPSLAQEVVTEGKRRLEGWRVKHRMGQNWNKMYDKGGGPAPSSHQVVGSSAHLGHPHANRVRQYGAVRSNCGQLGVPIASADRSLGLIGLMKTRPTANMPRCGK